jgi:hypothetical protein
MVVYHTLLHPTQFWVLVIGAIAPLGGYALNKLGPHVSEQVKAVVHVVLAAVAGALYQGLANGGVGFNSTTAQSIGSAILAALAAHHLLWKPSGIGMLFGAGQNRPGQVPAPVVDTGLLSNDQPVTPAGTVVPAQPGV